MERTRFVHYARSRTPKVITPTRPRPKSACSVFDPISPSEGKAPLAALEGDFQTLPRANRREKRQNGPRSYSMGRNEALPSSEFLASLENQAKCQDTENKSSPTEPMDGHSATVQRRHTMSSAIPWRAQNNEGGSRRVEPVVSSQEQSMNVDGERLEKKGKVEGYQQTLPIGPVLTLPRGQLSSPKVSRTSSFNISQSSGRYDWKSDPRRRPYVGDFESIETSVNRRKEESNHVKAGDSLYEFSRTQDRNSVFSDAPVPVTACHSVVGEHQYSTKHNTSFENTRYRDSVNYDEKSNQQSVKRSDSQVYVLLKSPHSRKNSQASTDSSTGEKVSIAGEFYNDRYLDQSKEYKQASNTKTLKCLNNNAITNVSVSGSRNSSKFEFSDQTTNFAYPLQQTRPVYKWTPENPRQEEAFKRQRQNIRQLQRVEQIGRNTQTSNKENSNHSRDNLQGRTPNVAKSHVSSEAPDENENTNFRNSWKRDSFRRATRGYTSMSDLTESIESLQIIEPVRKNDQYNAGSTLRIPDVTFGVSHNAERNVKHDGSNPVEGERDGGMLDSNDSTLEREKKLNKIKRDSFKIATSSFSDLTLLDIDTGEDVFESCDNIVCKENTFPYRNNNDQDRRDKTSYESAGNSLSHKTPQQAQEEQDYLNKIKRNSLRLATSSMSDLTCIVDEIDIDKPLPTLPASGSPSSMPRRVSQIHGGSPGLAKHWLRTGSLLSSKDSSSFGSYYSCRSMDFPSSKNSPISNGSSKKSGETCPSSPSVQGSITGRSKRSANDSGLDQSSFGDTSTYYSTVNSSFQSMDDQSSDISQSQSLQRSNHWRQPTFYWTRPSPYVRPHSNTLPSNFRNEHFATDHEKHRHRKTFTIVVNDYRYTHLPSSHKSSPSHSNNESRPSEYNSTCTHESRRERSSSEHPNLRPNHLDFNSRRKEDSMRGPHQLSSNCSTASENHQLFHSNNSRSEISPSRHSFPVDSPTLEAMRSPPSLGRPRRKVYAGFDSQPLPMESFMSDSSSVYTGGVSCSSRDTDLADPRDSGQFDESFNSIDTASFAPGNDVDSSFEALGRLVNSFYRRSDSQTSTLSQDYTRSSVHSTMTARSQDQRTSFCLDSEDADKDNLSRDEHEPTCESEDKISGQVKDFEVDLDSLSRLYSFENVTTSLQDFSLGCKMDMPSVKAYSSSCLVQPRPHSRLKCLSSRDIMDVIRTSSDNNTIGGCTSLVSLEKHANKVCRAILCCNEMQNGLVTKSYI